MKYDRFTVKAREAISDAQNLAGKLGNPEIRPHHLLMTLLEQDKGVVGSLIKHVGIPLDQFRRAILQRVEQHLAQLLEQQRADRASKSPEATLGSEILESRATRALQTSATTPDGEDDDAEHRFAETVLQPLDCSSNPQGFAVACSEAGTDILAEQRFAEEDADAKRQPCSPQGLAMAGAGKLAQTDACKEEAGHRIDVCKSGSDALAALASPPPGYFRSYRTSGPSHGKKA